MAQETTTVLVAGGDLAHLVRSLDAIEVIGVADSGGDAITRVVADLPDVLLLDTGIDDPGAREVCRRAREWAPATRVLAVTPCDDEHAYTTVVAGAAAVVGPPDSDRALADALTAVARGESLLLPHAAVRLLHDIDAWAERSADPIHPPPTLTATEREVLVRIGEGLDPTEIAAAHSVTSHLVNLHAGYAVAKLQRYVLGSERIAAGS